jgi:hypothetical protein
MKLGMKAIVTGLAMLAGGVAAAGSDLDAAMAAGGERMSADEIANLIVGKRVTAQAGDKVFDFYYAPDNTLDGRLQGGGWAGAGHYAITDGDQVCVSMTKDKGRYRCLTMVRQGDSLMKFNAAGKKTFELLEIEPSEGL